MCTDTFGPQTTFIEIAADSVRSISCASLVRWVQSYELADVRRKSIYLIALQLPRAEGGISAHDSISANAPRLFTAAGCKSSLANVEEQ